MRIAHVVPYFQPVIGYQEYFLAREQMKEGHEVCVITSDRYFPFIDYEETMASLLGPRFVGVGRFQERGIDVVRLPMLLEVGTFAFVRGLRAALKGFSPQLVHAHDEYTQMTLEAIMLKRSIGYRIVVDCHSHGYAMISFSRKFAYQAGLTRNPVTRFLLSKADGFIATTASARRWLEREWGIGRERIADIPLGADTDTFAPNPSARTAVRGKMGVDEDDVLVIYAGKLTPSKDIDVLIHAVAVLLGEGMPIKLLLVGGGTKPYLAALGSLVEQTGTGKAVFFLGPKPPSILASLFAASDIGVWPGDPSIAIVEAMAAGLPVIFPSPSAGHHFDLRHYVKRGNGYMFRRGDIYDLSDKLRKLSVNPRLRRGMGAASRSTAEALFSWRAVNRKTLHYYKLILSS